jgi:plastocyanin
MRRLGLLVAAAGLALGPAALAGAGSETRVAALDDLFTPETVRVAVGGTVTWSNDGRNPHTVTADDGAFDSGNIAAGATFSRTFDEPGVFAYHCSYHGAAGGLGMSGIVLVGDAEPPPEAGGEPGGVPPPPPGGGATVRVPQDRPTIQAAVDAASPGDLVLVSPGVYREAVEVTTPYLTIRGTDRNTVILDGGFELDNGIHALEADGVAVENMTARNYTLNGFYWTGSPRPTTATTACTRSTPSTASSTTPTPAGAPTPASTSGSAARATR